MWEIISQIKLVIYDVYELLEINQDLIKELVRNYKNK